MQVETMYYLFGEPLMASALPSPSNGFRFPVAMDEGPKVAHRAQL